MIVLRDATLKAGQRDILGILSNTLNSFARVFLCNICRFCCCVSVIKKGFLETQLVASVDPSVDPLSFERSNIKVWILGLVRIHN